MKMKYVQVQQQRKILQDATIVILRLKNPKTKTTENGKKRDNKKSSWETRYSKTN